MQDESDKTVPMDTSDMPASKQGGTEVKIKVSHILSGKRDVPQVVPSSDEEILSRFRSTHDFLRTYKLYIASEHDKRPLTHTGMDLKRLSVNDEWMNLFLKFCARDVFRNQVNYFCEILTPDAFRFFADFDIVSSRKLPLEHFVDLMKTYQSVMGRFFRSQHSVVVFMTHPAKVYKHGVWLYKYGMHPIWSDVIVNLAMALYIHELALATFKRVYPEPVAPSNGPDDYLDGAVYREKGGLRLAGCHKMAKCPVCKRKPKVLANCTTCDARTGLIHIGRPYYPKFYMSTEGEVNPKRSEMIVRNWNLAMQFGHIRMPKNCKVRQDFTVPINAPVPPQLDYDVDEFDPDSKISKQSKRYSEREKKALDEALEQRDHRLSDASKSKQATPFCDDAADASMVSVEALSGQAATKMHLKRIMRFEENRKTLSKYAGKVFIEKDSPALPTLEHAIQQYHPMYAHIKLECVFTNKPRTFFIGCVDGEGSFFCQNKRANHTNSQVYFYINRYGEMAQMCMSHRNVARAQGVKCSEFASQTRAVPRALMEQLMFKPSKSGLISTSLRTAMELDRYKQLITRRAQEIEQEQRKQMQDPQHQAKMMRVRLRKSPDDHRRMMQSVEVAFAAQERLKLAERQQNIVAVFDPSAAAAISSLVSHESDTPLAKILGKDSSVTLPAKPSLSNKMDCDAQNDHDDSVRTSNLDAKHTPMDKKIECDVVPDKLTPSTKPKTKLIHRVVDEEEEKDPVISYTEAIAQRKKSQLLKRGTMSTRFVRKRKREDENALVVARRQLVDKKWDWSDSDDGEGDDDEAADSAEHTTPL